MLVRARFYEYEIIGEQHHHVITGRGDVSGNYLDGSPGTLTYQEFTWNQADANDCQVEELL